MEGNHKEGVGTRPVFGPTNSCIHVLWPSVGWSSYSFRVGPRTEVIIPTDLTYWLTLNTHTNRSHGLQKCHIMSTSLLHTVGDCITLFPLTSHVNIHTNRSHYLLLLWILPAGGAHLQDVSHIMNILDTHTEATTFKGTHTCNQGDVRTLVSRG